MVGILLSNPIMYEKDIKMKSYEKQKLVKLLMNSKLNTNMIIHV